MKECLGIALLFLTAVLPGREKPGSGKVKKFYLQAWGGPEGSKRLGLPDFKTIDT
jgi:hypothetical protein